MEAKKAGKSRAIKVTIILPQDTNQHGTMFGGKLMSYIDELAAISAYRHARQPVVTASTDSVDFLSPVVIGNAICMEAFVSWTHNTSMEVFVKVVAEDLLTGERNLCATAFLTFVAIDDKGKPQVVPPLEPESEFQKELFSGATERAKTRRKKRANSIEFVRQAGLSKPWD